MMTYQPDCLTSPKALFYFDSTEHLINQRHTVTLSINESKTKRDGFEFQ